MSIAQGRDRQEINQLQHALDYSRRGWSVIPLQPKGKRPLIAWKPYQVRAADEQQIRDWWSQWPDANVGIVTGRVSNLIVLDIDSVDAFDELAGLDVPEGPIAKTSKGEHHYYTYPEDAGDLRNFAGTRFDDVDCRANGGYVVAPPSIHPSGARYTWMRGTIDAPLQGAPAWLIEEARKDKPKPEPERRQQHSTNGTNGTGANPWADAALQNEADTLARKTQGNRNDALNRAAFNLGQIVAGGYLSESDVRRALRRACEYNGLIRDDGEHAFTKTLESGLQNGMSEPRHPPKSEALGAKDYASADSADAGAAGAKMEEPDDGWTAYIGDRICESDHFARNEGDDLYRYDAGVYRPKAKRYIARRTKELLAEWDRKDVWSKYRANEVGGYIAADAPTLWDRPPAGRLNLQNGILDLNTRELQPHTHKWLSSVQLPVEYDPEADCPNWKRFIADWFPEDAVDAGIPWQLLAWVIQPNVTIQKAALLLGNGENGKSRFLAGVKALLDRHNVVGISLHKLEENRFATAHLYGKIANICPDLPSTHLQSTSIFKALTGGDYVHAEIKHGELFEFESHTRLLFSANQPPVSKDSSKAFFRRWLVIPFDATFDKAEKLPEAEIDAMLSEPAELSGALNMALEYVDHVRRHGIDETESMRETWLQFREVTDPVEVWLDTNTVERPEAYVIKGELTKAYNEAARANGWPVLTSKDFGIRVKEWKPGLRDGQKRIAGKRPTVWYGIGLKSPENAPFTG